MDCENLAQNEQGLVSAKASSFILFLSSLCKKGLRRRNAAEGPFLFSSSLYFAFTCRQFLCLFLPLYSFADLIWKVHSLKSLPGRRWIVRTAQHWCLEDATFCWNAKTEPSCWILFLNYLLWHLRKSLGCTKQNDFHFFIIQLRKPWFSLVVGRWWVLFTLHWVESFLERNTSQRMRVRWHLSNPCILWVCTTFYKVVMMLRSSGLPQLLARGPLHYSAFSIPPR